MPPSEGNAERPTTREQDVDDDDERDRAEEAARQVTARAPRLLGVVGDGLETGVGEHREGDREGDVVPRRVRAEREAARQRARREEEHHPAADEQQLRHQVEDRDADAERVEPCAAEEPDACDARDDDAGGDHVTGSAGDRVDAEREAEVVRDEECGQRDHDQVVEEEHPAREEAGEVVEGDADERRSPTGLADRRGALRIRERDDQEEEPDDAEHERREPERVQRDDAEREVERRRDLAVGNRGERRRVENSLELGELPSHYLRLRRWMRAVPSAMKRAPTAKPTVPPPWRAV